MGLNYGDRLGNINAYNIYKGRNLLLVSIEKLYLEMEDGITSVMKFLNMIKRGNRSLTHKCLYLMIDIVVKYLCMENSTRRAKGTLSFGLRIEIVNTKHQQLTFSQTSLIT